MTKQNKKTDQDPIVTNGDRATFKQRVLTDLATAEATQRQLEDTAGISRGMLSHYFRGPRTPKASDLRLIAEAIVRLQGKSMEEFAVHPVEALVAGTGFVKLFALSTTPTADFQHANLHTQIANLQAKLVEAHTTAAAEAQARISTEKDLHAASTKLDAASRELSGLRSKVAATESMLESVNLEVLQGRTTHADTVRARDDAKARAARLEVELRLPERDPFTAVLNAREIFTWRQYALALQQERDGLLVHLNDARQKLAAKDGSGAGVVLAGLFGVAVGAMAASKS